MTSVATRLPPPWSPPNSDPMLIAAAIPSPIRMIFRGERRGTGWAGFVGSSGSSAQPAMYSAAPMPANVATTNPIRTSVGSTS